MDELMKGHGDLADPVRLCDAQLGNLPPDVLRPTYNRQAITPGIVHIGLGNFHRAHQAWYTHRLMQQGEALNWGMIGAGVRTFDEEQRKKLAAQDYLSTLIELDPAGATAEVVGSMIGYVPVEHGHHALIAQMAEPTIKIVSLTITEGGYFLDHATKAFDGAHPDMVFDAANPASPRTVFGAIIAALKIRRDADLGPFTCLSCDNLPGNGTIMRNVTLGLAKLSDPALADWIGTHVSFPNSMVDCIVPATGPDELALVRRLGVQDDAPVTHENFRQWVIEDDFCAGRPPWEHVGATLSDRVHAYEAMKLRILNGGHQIIAAPAELLGLSTIADAMETPPIRAFMRQVALEEIGPHVSDVPDMTVAAYVDLVDTRFSNPAIHDRVRRVAFDGSSRHTGAVLPVIRDAIAAGGPIDGLALSQALWARMCAGTREDGSTIDPNDPIWDELAKTARSAAKEPQVWLKQSHIYGDLAHEPRFAKAFSDWVFCLNNNGVEATLQMYLSRS